MKICFLLNHIPDPRINKRIEVAKQCGKVNVICIRRKDQDIWEPVHKDIKHKVFNINLPSSKHIVQRISMFYFYKKRLLKELNKINPEIVYIDGFDSLLIAGLYKRKKHAELIYEVADLREDFIEIPKNPISKIKKYILSYVEKKSIGKLSLLVLTSMKFYDLHYRKIINKKKILYIPNIPDISVFKNYKHKEKGEFTVGFIGGIRYIQQMKMLVDVAEKVKCKVLFAGAGGTSTDYEEIRGYCANKDYVEFTGKYDYKSQIAKLYASVDCVYAVYDASNPNVRIALPNKLYESVYCELPIIVAKNTYLSEIVEKYKIGISVNYESELELYTCLTALMNEKIYKEIEKNCKENKALLVKNTWKNKLIERIKRMKADD